MSGFLPINQNEAAQRGWDQVDFICVTGDSYVDHPSFGIAIISRLLESMGFRVAMLAQPNLKNDADFTQFGRPALGFFITGGNIDSMVSNYTAAKKRRSDDAYTAGGKAGSRPDHAVNVYVQTAKRIYPDCPVMIGGIEASLRRFAHYDYWDNVVRPSALVDSGADLLSYGMGELQTRIIADRLRCGEPISDLTDIPGTSCFCPPHRIPAGAVSCASFEKVAADKSAYLRAFKQQLDEQDAIAGKAVVQKHGDRFVLQNSPMRPLTTQELDEVFTLPFMRAYHPSYEAAGGVKAIEEVEFSIMHNRGCFGHCNFCSIAIHQGRRVVSRSHDSILTEAQAFVQNPRFKGYIHDVGGPTANFRAPSCDKQLTAGMCTNRKCLGTKPCPSLKVDHSDYLSLLRKLRSIKEVKKVFVRSGLRFDYLLEDRDDTFFKELVVNHVSGQLKVAPEHCSNTVLALMGKPPIDVYNRFAKKFYQITERAGMKQYLVPYLMSSHPGSRVQDAVELALFLKTNNMRPEQVQDFYPTPGTISTCMFYTGFNPLTGEPVYVPRTESEKRKQRALLQYYKPENRPIIVETLTEIGRTDLIGYGADCLVFPVSRLRQPASSPTVTSDPHLSKQPASPIKDKTTDSRRSQPSAFPTKDTTKDRNLSHSKASPVKTTATDSRQNKSSATPKKDNATDLRNSQRPTSFAKNKALDSRKSQSAFSAKDMATDKTTKYSGKKHR